MVRITLTIGADWKVIGASGRQAGVEDKVADLRTTEPNFNYSVHEREGVS